MKIVVLYCDSEKRNEKKCHTSAACGKTSSLKELEIKGHKPNELRIMSRRRGFARLSHEL